jgi:hypothetical protein
VSKRSARADIHESRADATKRMKLLTTLVFLLVSTIRVNGIINGYKLPVTLWVIDKQNETLTQVSLQ